MALTRLFDHYKLGFFERRRCKHLATYWVTDDLDDVYKVQDYVATGILFDAKKPGRYCERFFGIDPALLQSYKIFVQQRAQVELTGELVETIRKIEDGVAIDWPQGILINPGIRALLEDRLIPVGGGHANVVEVYDPVIAVDSLLSHPLMIGAFVALPGKRQRDYSQTISWSEAIKRLLPTMNPAPFYG